MKIYSYLEFLSIKKEAGDMCLYGDKKCNPSETSRLCLDCYDDYVERNLPQPKVKAWVSSKWRKKPCLED